MNSVLRSLQFGLLALALCACQTTTQGGGEQASVSSDRIQRILESGELRVGLSGNQPPLNMRNKRGEIIGMVLALPPFSLLSRNRSLNGNPRRDGRPKRPLLVRELRTHARSVGTIDGRTTASPSCPRGRSSRTTCAGR